MKSVSFWTAIVGFGCLATATAAQVPPDGTVIAWRPSIEAIDFKAKTIDIPRGWRVCDFRGSEHPSVYLKGLTVEDYVQKADPADPAQKGLYGGSPRHTHSARTERTDFLKTNLGEKNETHAADSLHTHPVIVDPAPHDPPFASVIFLCASSGQVVADFSSSGYGGSQITLVRQGKTFSGAAPRSYAVCNTSATPLKIGFRAVQTGANTVATGVPDGTVLAKGDCVGMDRPAWLRVSSTVANNEIGGQFHAVRAGTFPREGVRFERKTMDSSLRQSVALGSVKTLDSFDQPVDCKVLPPNSPLRAKFYSACDIRLPRAGSYRLCFPTGHLIGAPGNFAFGIQRLIVDRDRLRKGWTDKEPDPSSTLPAGSCMDLWNISDAIVLIAPPVKGPVHDPATVTGVKVTVHSLDFEQQSK